MFINMQFTLLPLRYALFAFLLASSAIQCSVAVWNLSFSAFAGQTSQVDAFLTFLGALFLLFIFLIIFIEMFRENAVTERLWFEVSWVALFWIMELSGAAALSAIVPGNCQAAQGLSGSADVCTSGRVLLAFTWMPTILLMIYLALLLCGIIVHQKNDPEIWHASAREFCRTKTRQLLSSTPVSPVLPRFKGIPVLEIVAPQPKLSAPATAYSHRAGMGPDYGIEFYSPTGERDLTSLQQPKQTVQRTRTTTMAMAPAAVPAPSLYPIHSQSFVRPSGQPPLRTPAGSSPPPLGDWPRADAVNQPVRKNSKRKPVPTGLGADAPVTTPPVGTAPEATVTNTRPRTQRKRTGSGEIHRPPPLDLTKISAFN